jgi:hypothetical protein
MEKHNEEKSYDDDGEESEDNEKCNCFSSLCAFRPFAFKGKEVFLKSILIGALVLMWRRRAERNAE